MVTIEVGNIRSYIRGFVHYKVLNKISTALSFELPGAYYARMYNPMAGTKRLFSPTTQSFPTGLLYKVVHILKRNGINCHLKDTRNKVSFGKDELKVHGIEFRDYQQDAINEAIKRQRGIIKIGTGGGKTNVFIGIVAKLNIPTLILIHKTDVFWQIVDRLEQALKIKVGKVGDNVCDIQPITVAMIQTLGTVFSTGSNRTQGNKTVFVKDSEDVKKKKKLIVNLVKNTECIITDECHHVVADTFVGIHKSASKAVFRIGMSASPWRDDNHDMLIEGYQGRVIIDVPASELIKRAYLARPMINLFQFKHKRKSRSRVKYHTLYDDEVVENFDRNKLISDIAISAAERNKTVLIAITKVEHGQRLESILKAIEPNSVFVFGESQSELRKNVLKELNERKRKIVICTTIFGEGIDVPNLDVLINAKAGASSVDAFQLVGRVLRKTETKNKAYIIDIFDKACKYLEAHSYSREKIYRTEPNYIIKKVSRHDEITFNDNDW